ncbi:unnamed protein product [Cuscuta europaea]|uniref:glucan endo-1,3-beta-D-glucosidase n=1 Tax=Cuscuta europaea TaxID=41803 RepID=A0A9P1DZC9_CUSEU|nr:unnamed protein product [Cuscuta europaea]
MEHKAFPFPAPLLLQLTLFFSVIFCPVKVICIGINYGQIANNLPAPENAVQLVQCIGATKVKLYDADPKVLTAFANTSVELIVSIGNEYLPEMSDCNRAKDWVLHNVISHLQWTKITGIIVGNEVLTSGNATLLLPAIRNVYDALVSLNLQHQIQVTTAHSLAVLEASYPPSSGRFNSTLAAYYICELLKFSNITGAPILINAYPYFAYQADPENVRLEYALFQPNTGTNDRNVHYDNLLFAQIDAVYAAAAKMGYNNVCVQVSETGWPSKGDPAEAAATKQNAMTYNRNLLNLAAQNKGRTPLSPAGCNLEVSVFALFNENQKPGPLSERNYGLFNADGSPAYQIGSSACGNTNSSIGSGPASGTFPPTTLSPTAGSPGNLYIPISSDAVRAHLCIKRFGCVLMVAFLCYIALNKM